MKITWPDSYGKEITGHIEAALWPFVSVLGAERTASLLMRFGGSYVHLSERCSNRNRLSQFMTSEEARLLIDQGIGPGGYRLPLANQFLARYLRSRGRNLNEICWALRISEVSARAALKPDHVRRARILANKERMGLLPEGAQLRVVSEQPKAICSGSPEEKIEIKADLKAVERVSLPKRTVEPGANSARATGAALRSRDD